MAGRPRTFRIAAAALVVAGVLAGVVGPSRARASGCTTRPVLVLAAMPLELNPLIAKAVLDPEPTVINHRTFYTGRLAGHPVVLAMTGIGITNATETATAAFEHFRCPFAAAVFSGVAGSPQFIGDVLVPQRWSLDKGRTWMPADPTLLRIARTLAPEGKVPLSRRVPVGDAACLCPGVDAPTPVSVTSQPRVLVGGNGASDDTFSGRALPCVPGGGDVAGCEPCIKAGTALDNVARFASDVPKLANLEFFKGFLSVPQSAVTKVDVQDMETAAVVKVARQHHTPFLGIRAVSDGQGDPLHLPGFPFQFFTYRQLAGNNAAAVTIAFLHAYRG